MSVRRTKFQLSRFQFKYKEIIAKQALKPPGVKRSSFRENATVVVTVNVTGVKMPSLPVCKGQTLEVQ